MKSAKIGELRNGLSRYLAHVRAGGKVIVYDRETPIAEIIPIMHSKHRKLADEERLARLEARGIIRRGSGDGKKFQRMKPIKIPGAASVLEALLEERESGW
jgi:antitoxin (DNA-binding transcriptional repressor) of toxin-antitoxin stability system